MFGHPAAAWRMRAQTHKHARALCVCVWARGRGGRRDRDRDRDKERERERERGVRGRRGERGGMERGRWRGRGRVRGKEGDKGREREKKRAGGGSERGEEPELLLDWWHVHLVLKIVALQESIAHCILGRTFRTEMCETWISGYLEQHFANRVLRCSANSRAGGPSRLVASCPHLGHLLRDLVRMRILLW
eukprot:2402614-Pleurochrysis_carterae.AAC.2